MRTFQIQIYHRKDGQGLVVADASFEGNEKVVLHKPEPAGVPFSFKEDEMALQKLIDALKQELKDIGVAEKDIQIDTNNKQQTTIELVSDNATFVIKEDGLISVTSDDLLQMFFFYNSVVYSIESTLFKKEV